MISFSVKSQAHLWCWATKHLQQDANVNLHSTSIWLHTVDIASSSNHDTDMQAHERMWPAGNCVGPAVQPNTLRHQCWGLKPMLHMIKMHVQLGFHHPALGPQGIELHIYLQATSASARHGAWQCLHIWCKCLTCHSSLASALCRHVDVLLACCRGTRFALHTSAHHEHQSVTTITVMAICTTVSGVLNLPSLFVLLASLTVSIIMLSPKMPVCAADIICPPTRPDSPVNSILHNDLAMFSGPCAVQVRSIAL